MSLNNAARGGGGIMVIGKTTARAMEFSAVEFDARISAGRAVLKHGNSL
jgi:hypothetical protein